MTNSDYERLVNAKAKPSPMAKNLLWAFLVGGAISTLGQGLLNFYQSRGLDQDQAGTAVSVTLIFLAALFTGLGWFDKLAKHAGPVLVYGISASVLYGILLALFGGG